MKMKIVAMAAAGFVLLATPGPAAASDYFNECKTADTRFEINDDTLYAKSEATKPIDFETLEKHITSERRGYCMSQGKRFDFEGRNSTMRIRVNYQGSRIETTATCEYVASGLPAAYNCEREVVTFDNSKGSGSGGSSGGNGAGEVASCGTGSVWNHNGSEMRLLAEGSIRRFAYERPRRGLSVNPCDVVFEGEKQGDNYAGTGYVFSKRCGPIGYPVSGPVLSDGARVTLYGQAPRRRNDCSVSGYRDDTLVFEYLRSE